MKVTRQQLWTFLNNQEETYEDFVPCSEDSGLTVADFNALHTLLEDKVGNPIRQIVADQGMSENHLGGDDLVSVVDQTLAAIKDGYEIATWYGPETEVLVVGYRPDYLTVEG